MRGSRPARVGPAAGLRRAGSVVLAGGLALGCAATPLPYEASTPTAGVRVSADYRTKDGHLRVELETEGYRVESVAILLPDGSAVPPESLESPVPRRGGFSIGVGVGSMGSVGGVGTGVGVGAGTGAGGRASSTFVVFPLDRVGPAPWTLRVKVVGADPVVIVLPPAPAPS